MNMINTNLKITLKSDLCVSSGFSYAGVIDNDITYNKNGIPYIAGRRIKGCLREAAKQINIYEDTISAIFGESGSDDVKGILMGNGFPKGWQEIDRQLSLVKENGGDLATYLNAQNVLNLFAEVKAQTKLTDEGCADENTLRFTRTISQYDCISGNELVFLAPFSYPKTHKDAIVKILKATRHIGMNRNRGLGNVVLELEGANTDVPFDFKDEIKAGSGKKKKITFVIRNVTPLRLSGENEIGSILYIPGSNLLGALAGTYLKTGSKERSHSPEDELFKKFFLRGETVFSNLTITEKINGQWLDYAPAPLYINRLKKTKKLVNLLGAPKTQCDEKSEYYMLNGNQPKKLKTHFVATDGANSQYHIREVSTEVVYHHSKDGTGRSGEKGILYFWETISENQYFKGNIIVDEESCPEMLSLLKSSALRFGKSKSAQYGSCKLELEEVSVSEYLPPVIDKERIGQHIALTFLSDGIFMDSEGNYTVKKDEVSKILADRFKLQLVGGDEEEKATFIQTKEITGYNAKWNLKKQAIPAIKAGSSFEFVIGPDTVSELSHVGEKNQEGFGNVKIVYIEDVQFEASSISSQRDANEIDKEILAPIMEPIMKERIYEEISKGAFEKSDLNISAAALGRITLMLSECENETRGLKDSAFEMIEKYIERIESIKDSTKRKQIRKFLNDTLLGETEEDDKKYTPDKAKIVETMVKGNDASYKVLQNQFGKEEAIALVFELWPRYFKDILTLEKYNKKN